MRKIIVFSICFAFFATNMCAQRMQKSQTFSTPTPISISGQEVYSYIVGEDGKNLKDGAYSFNANVSNKTIHLDYVRTATFNANYKLTANFKKGFLNGPLSLTARFAATRHGKTDTEIITLTGNMQDGFPHGAFNVNNGLDGYTEKLSANYNKGLLVGNFSCKTLIEGVLYNVQGTLTQNGELNGQWKYNTNIRPITYVFQNGVMISKSFEDESTPPSMVELAKKYANKLITEKELAEQNIAVLRDSLPLNSLAVDVIFKESTIDWDRMGTYDFKGGQCVGYTYLKKLPFFTDKGVDMLWELMKEAYLTQTNYISNVSTGGKLGVIKERGVAPSVSFYGSIKPYTTDDVPHNVGGSVYLKAEQIQRMEEFMHSIRKDNMPEFKDVLEKYNSSSLVNFLYGTNEDINYGRVKAEASDFLFSEYYPISKIPDTTLFRKGDNLTCFYIDQKSLEPLFLLVGRYDWLVKTQNADEAEQMRLKEMEKNLLNRLETGINEARKAALVEKFQSTFDFLSNSSALSIAFSEEKSNYIFLDGCTTLQVLL